MDFLSAYYWQQASNRSSLLLQQYACEGTVVLFACVCMGRDGNGRVSGYMTGRLLCWFRNLNLRRLVKRTEREMKAVRRSLEGVVARTDGELASSGLSEAGQDAALAGVLCVGERFFLFYRGRQRIWLINTSFGRAYTDRIGADGEVFCVEEGVLEPDVGLLLAVGREGLPDVERMVREGLSVREVLTEEQMERHLRELLAESARRGESDMAAVFLRSCI